MSNSEPVMYPRSMRNLIESFRLLPGIGEKAAERHVMYVLTGMDKYDAKKFAENILDVIEKVHTCPICGNLTENDVCDICKNPERDKSIICVVQSSKDILVMEKAGEFKGRYFVLNGLINPIKGVMPEDINIPRLIDLAGTANEIILATSITQEGDLTAQYINKLLREKYPNLLVSRIARGLPTGGYLDYADEMTLSHALSDRKRLD